MKEDSMALVVFLLVWCAFAFACFKVAESKGRNKWLWAVMGFIFTIFALLVVAVVGKTDAMRVQDQQSFGQQQAAFNTNIPRCPHCLSAVPAMASVCATCRRDIAATPDGSPYVIAPIASR